MKIRYLSKKVRPASRLKRWLMPMAILSFFCLGLVPLGRAQSGNSPTQITGKIKDENNTGIPGASIVVRGTSVGTTSDVDGKFSLSVPDKKATILVSFVGYQAQEITVGNRSTFDVTLAQSIDELNEVVVGYGTQRKQTLTGSISNITNEEIKTTTHTSLAQSLQGKVAGVQIRQNSGEPGRFSTNINIRGFGEPLYVVDGVARDGGFDFQKINPDDIESISVLKDASAAIYGIRAGNGVVIVTTKKGKKGKPEFSYTAIYGRQ